MALCIAWLATPGAEATAIQMAVVNVGDTGNIADSTVAVTDTTTGYGSVAYSYAIGKYDVTLTQYAAFLNAVAVAGDPYGLYNASLATDAHIAGISRSGAFGAFSYAVIGSGSNPVTYVSWLDAARFCNWLQNGQPQSGSETVSTTEEGAYTLDGDISTGLETKNVRATWWIPTEDEWYKAAYYDPTIGGTGGYWIFPTQSATAPANNFQSPTDPNQANYIATSLYSVTQDSVEDADQNYLTPGGAFTSSTSHYGTYDQGGDVYQWNDALIGSAARGVRGGSWQDTANTLQSDDRESRQSTGENPGVGFRVATNPNFTPVISDLSSTGTEGQSYSYHINATNIPTSFTAAPLPSGVTIAKSTGEITGTPTQSGSFSTTLTAANASGTGTAILSLVIEPFAAPVISDTTSVSGTAQVALTYQIEATGSGITSYNASSLPDGLAVTATSGLVSGTPTTLGTFSATVDAIGSGGTGSAIVMFDIAPPPIPTVSSTSNAVGELNDPFSYQIVANFEPDLFTASPLPTGVMVNGTTGLISGTPSQTGPFTVIETAANAGGTGTASFDLNILPPPPSISSMLAATGSNGAEFEYDILTVDNDATSFGATGLPPGLTVDSTNGVISGTLAAGGIFPISLKAISASGTGTATLVLTVSTSFAKLQANYEGLAAVNGTTSGLFTATVSGTGAFTAAINVPNTKYTLKGNFSPLGTYGAVVGQGAATLQVILNTNAASPTVSGTVRAVTSAGTKTYSVSGTPLGKFTANTIPIGIAGYYTVMLPALSNTNSAVPNAYGYASVKVANSGAITVAGKLGDGATFTAASQLHADGKSWTLYTPLYGTMFPGGIAGNMTFEAAAGSDADGTLRWVKSENLNNLYYPLGFSVNIDMFAAHYAAPALGTGAGSIDFTGGNLAISGTGVAAISGTTYDLTAASTGKITTTVPGLTVTVTKATGAFKGQFTDPATSKKLPFAGLIYQKPAPPSGFGLFLGPSQTGGVEISQ